MYGASFPGDLRKSHGHSLGLLEQRSGLDQMASRGPFLLQPLFHSVKDTHSQFITTIASNFEHTDEFIYVINYRNYGMISLTHLIYIDELLVVPFENLAFVSLFIHSLTFNEKTLKSAILHLSISGP